MNKYLFEVEEGAVKLVAAEADAEELERIAKQAIDAAGELREEATAIASECRKAGLNKAPLPRSASIREAREALNTARSRDRERAAEMLPFAEGLMATESVEDVEVSRALSEFRRGIPHWKAEGLSETEYRRVNALRELAEAAISESPLSPAQRARKVRCLELGWCQQLVRFILSGELRVDVSEAPTKEPHPAPLVPAPEVDSASHESSDTLLPGMQVPPTSEADIPAAPVGLPDVSELARKRKHEPSLPSTSGPRRRTPGLSGRLESFRGGTAERAFDDQSPVLQHVLPSGGRLDLAEVLQSVEYPKIVASVACAPPPDTQPRRKVDVGNPESRPAPELERMHSEPSTIPSWPAFQASHWAAADGSCTPSPWMEAPEEHVKRLRDASLRAMLQARLAEVYLHEAALEELGAPALFGRLLLSDFMQVLAAGRPLRSDEERSAELSSAIENALIEEPQAGSALSSSLAIQLTIHFAGTYSAPLAQDAIEILEGLDGLSGDSRVDSLLLELMRLEAKGIEPLHELRAGTVVGSSAKERLDKFRDATRVVLEVDYRTWWDQLRKVRTRHCKEAWRIFLEEEVRPVTRRLRRIADSFDRRAAEELREVQQGIVGLSKRHREIADRHEAKYEDRRHMDRWAEDVIDKLLGTSRLGVDALEGPGLTSFRAPLDVSCLSHPPEPGANGVAHLICTALSRLMGEAADASPDRSPIVTISSELVCRQPALLEHFPDVFKRGDSVPKPDPVACVDVRSASALVLSAEEGRGIAESGRPKNMEELVEALHSVGRHRVASIAASFSGRPFEEADMALEREEQAIQDSADRLERRAKELTAMSSPFDRLALEASATVRGVLASWNGSDNARIVLGAWIESALKSCDRWRQDSVERILERAREAGEESLAKVKAHLAREDYFSAAGSIGSRDTAEGDSHRFREIEWRRLAEERYPNPLRALEEYSKQDERLAELLRAWGKARGRADVRGKEGHDLRNKFWRFVAPLKYEGDTQLREMKPESGITVRFPALAAVYRADNPLFLPQLSDPETKGIDLRSFGDPNDSGFVGQVANMAREAGSSRIAVVLAPGLTPEVRLNARRKLEQQAEGRLRFALVDEVDLCRLALDGKDAPNRMLGLLEIVFEQQKLVSPFETGEGSQVKMEMFVGRRDVAKDILTKPGITRVFSGRQLGKTALLRFIEERAKDLLDAESEVRVIRLSAAGYEHEAELATAILRELHNLKLLPFAPQEAEDRPTERLVEAFEQILSATPRKTRFLVLVDEADAFVEHEIDRYSRVREKCLSFVMVKRLGASPGDRLRFVFVGYRQTNTMAGVWASAGLPLGLEPLTDAEAQRLFAAPLARIGVDAMEAAPIVSRLCGQQPAMILELGRELVQRSLRPGSNPQNRDRLVVRPADVYEAFRASAVQRRLESIVDGNFTHAPSARATFLAFLLELFDRSAHDAISDAAHSILRRLTALSPGGDMSWYGGGDPAPLRAVTQELAELRDRNLLREERDGSFRLRVPEHFRALAGKDTESLSLRLNRAIEDAKQGGGGQSSWRGLLAESDFSSYAKLLREEKAFHPLSIVFAGLWHAPLLATCERLTGDTAVGISALEWWRRIEQLGEEGSGAVAHAGGLSLLRSALRNRRNDVGVNVEVWPGGRWNERQIRWYFERRRALEIRDEAFPRKIVEATGGIPILLEALDAVLPKEGGLVSNLDELLGQLTTRRGELLERLIARDTAEDALDGSERALLSTIIELAKRVDAQLPERIVASGEGLTLDEIATYAQVLGLPASDSLGDDPKHRLSLEVLAISGTLDVRDGAFVRLSSSDPILDLHLAP